MTAVPEPDARPPTLGELLSEAGLRLRDRHVPVYSWAAAFTPVRERLEQLDQSWAERFQRVDGGGTAALPRLRRPHGAATSAPAVAPPPVIPAAPSPAAEDRIPDRAPPPPPVTSLRAPAASVLPRDVRSRLRELAGPGAERMQVRIGPASDAVARAHSADAVTMGTEVHVRAGRYRTGTPGGFALLAHEARHVTALLRRGRAADRTTAVGPAAEERAAREVEHRAFLAVPRPGAGRTAEPAPRPPSGPGPLAPPAAAQPGAAQPAATRPMAAAVDRAPDRAPAAPGFDLEGLKRNLIDDIMRRLHSDFERGA